VPPQLLVLIGAGSVQFGAAFAHNLFDRAGPGGVVFLRLAFGAVLMLAIVRPRIAGRTREDWIAVGAFGFVLAAMNWSFYEALDRLPLGPAVTIEFVGPLTLAVVGSRRLLDVLWVVLAGSGVALLSLGRGGGSGNEKLSTSGLALIALAGTCWVGYILLSKRVGSRFDGLDGLAFALAIGTVLVLPVGLVQGGTALANPVVLGGGFCVAVLSSVIPYSLELIALRRLKASTFGLLMSLEPAVAALAGVLVLGQALGWKTALAMILVITASAGTSVADSRTALPPRD
jgi:inner membrane transporter RhtA